MWVVWEGRKKRQCDTWSDIYCQVVSDRAPLLAQDMAVCQNPYDQFEPSLDSSGLGGVGIVWEDHRFDPLRGMAGSVFGRALSLTDNSLSPERDFAIAAPDGDAIYPVISSSGLDGSIIAYTVSGLPLQGGMAAYGDLSA